MYERKLPAEFADVHFASVDIAALPALAARAGMALCRKRNKRAQPSASWRSGGLPQRQTTPKAASGSGQPRPINQ